MTSKSLEERAGETLTGRIQTVVETIDRYAIGTLALYCFRYPDCPHGSPFVYDAHRDSSQFRQFESPEPSGLMDPQPFQYGYDLGEGYQFHMHGPDRTTLTFGSLEFRNEPVKSFDGYESAMIDFMLNNNFKKFP